MEAGTKAGRSHRYWDSTVLELDLLTDLPQTKQTLMDGNGIFDVRWYKSCYRASVQRVEVRILLE